MPRRARPDPTARVRAALGEFAPALRVAQAAPVDRVDPVDPVDPVDDSPGDPDFEGGPASPGDPGEGGPRHARTAPRWAGPPAGIRGADRWIGFPAALGFLAVVVVAATVFGVRVLAAERAAAPVPTPPVSTGTSGSGPSAGPSSSPTSSGSGSLGSGGVAPGPEPGGAGAVVVVHVVGQVHRAGVVRLPSGSRVIEAIAAAGGATRSADLSAVNLARVLVDGEQVRVPEPGEVTGPIDAGGGTAGGSGGGGGGGGGAPGGGGPVSLNRADAASLDTLPGVGPVLAARILAWRTEHGRFTSVDELGEVAGIGEKLLAQLRPLVTL